MKTQTQNILAHLQLGNSITPIEALNMFGCLRLSARIKEIKDMQYHIDTKIKSVGDHKHVAEYSLVNPFTEL